MLFAKRMIILWILIPCDMLIDKEYPATHSMSTSWYIVDDEGNVGIMDFNENGPVPWEVEESCIEQLVFGHIANDEANEAFDLTDEQINDLIENPHSPESEEFWYNCVVRIDITKEKEFLLLCKNEDFRCKHCLSKSRGLYLVDDRHHVIDNTESNANHPPKESTLNTMIDRRIILEVYDAKQFDMNDEYHGGVVEHTKDFDTAPYFIFNQPYWNEFLPHKMVVPEHPVKIDQVPESFRSRIYRIPGSFRVLDTFQIAEWHPCRMTGGVEPAIVVDGCDYQLLPMSDGTHAYVLQEIIDFDFYPYCSEKEKYGCEKCSSLCHDTEYRMFTDKPTVVMIGSLESELEYEYVVTADTVIQHAIWIAYLPKIPKQEGRYSCYKRETVKSMSTELLIEIFSKAHGYFDAIIDYLNPRVLILEKKARKVFESVYKVENHKVVISNREYSIYFDSERKKYKEEIERLAILPYQGKEHPHIITKDMMEVLLKNGKAKKYNE